MPLSLTDFPSTAEIPYEQIRDQAQSRYIGKGPAGGFVGIVLIPRLISSPRNCEENI
jgi:hypothetical protein